MPGPPLLRSAGVLLLTLLMAESQSAESLGVTSENQLADLTGSTNVVVTLTGRDNFANEFKYDVRVKNQSAAPLAADSLVLVLDRVTDLAGKDALERMEVAGQDGETADKKPYFRVPVDGSELAPYGESKPATVILKNAVYTIIFTPLFKVLGRANPPPAAPRDPVQSLVDLLIKKGVLTAEEGAAINRRTPAPPPLP